MSQTIHLISHTHWDREWYLTFQQFRLKLVHLIDGLLELLDKDPEYKYYLLDGQAIILEDYLQIRPEREHDLIQYIQTGRISIGPWYISPDEYLIAPESHIRNLLEGDRICQEFGIKMQVGYLPDTFGHIGQMPQILQGFGIDSACVWRGLDDQPCELTWSAPNGSNVLLSYLRDSYSNAASLVTSNPDIFMMGVDEHIHSLSPYSLTGQILLMHGTDHMEPTIDLSDAMEAYRRKSTQDELVHSNLPLYFNALRASLKSTHSQLTEIIGELRSSKHSPLLRNVLSTRIWIKQRNHACENDLLKWVEPSAAWINLTSEPQPDSPSNNHRELPKILTDQNSIIRYAWKRLMQCHPHDSICGTSIDQVAREMVIRFDEVDQINRELVIQNLQKISDQVDTRVPPNLSMPGNGQNIISAIIIFNPNDVAQTGLVNLKLKLENHVTSFEIIDEQGCEVPYDQSGIGLTELISMTLDKKSLKQTLGMIHEGKAAGMIISEFNITRDGNLATIRVTLSDHGDVDLNKWRSGIAQLEGLFANPDVNGFLIHAYSDPEIDISMVAHQVPGHGYRSYWIRGRNEQVIKASEQVKINPIVKGLLPIASYFTQLPILSRLVSLRNIKPKISANKIENEYFIVKVNVSNGELSVFDKHTGKLYSGLNRFVDGADVGDVYNYCPPEQDHLLTGRVKKVESIEQKSIQKLIVHMELELPSEISSDRKSRSHQKVINPIKSTITVVPGVPRIDIHTEIDNRACDHRLRAYFTAPFKTSYSYQDGHFEIVKRTIQLPGFDSTWEEPPRREAPQCQFTSIMDENSSLTIANRGLPEVEVFVNEEDKAEIAITLLRCIGWLSRDDLTTRKGHAGPMGVATPEAQIPGLSSFDYSIIPGDRNWQKSIHHAYAFNAPLKPISTLIHPGVLPPRASFIENKNEDFIITAIKSAEHDAGFIIRGFNISSSPIEISVKPWKKFSHANLVTLDERLLKELPISTDGIVKISAGGHQIITIRIFD